jgi:hypothetical protein
MRPTKIPASDPPSTWGRASVDVLVEIGLKVKK